MRAFKHITSTKKILKNSKPHADMVYWALQKAKAAATEAEHIQYDGLLEESLKDLEKYFASLEAEGGEACS